MTTPVTRIDTRFSEPDAVATEWTETLRIIQAAELFWIATVRADGRPHVTPLVAVWLDGALHFCTGDGEQKQLNLTANPHVVLTTGSNAWAEGVDVVLEGTAVPVTDDHQLVRLADAWAAKWDGRWRYETRDGSFWQGEHRVGVYAVRPAKVLAFAKGDARFSHTAHRF